MNIKMENILLFGTAEKRDFFVCTSLRNGYSQNIIIMESFKIIKVDERYMVEIGVLQTHINGYFFLH